MHSQDYLTEIIQLLFQMVSFLERLNIQESQFLHQLNDYVYEKVPINDHLRPGPSSIALSKSLVVA